MSESRPKLNNEVVEAKPKLNNEIKRGSAKFRGWENLTDWTGVGYANHDLYAQRRTQNYPYPHYAYGYQSMMPQYQIMPGFPAYSDKPLVQQPKKEAKPLDADAILAKYLPKVKSKDKRRQNRVPMPDLTPKPTPKPIDLNKAQITFSILKKTSNKPVVKKIVFNDSDDSDAELMTSPAKKEKVVKDEKVENRVKEETTETFDGKEKKTEAERPKIVPLAEDQSPEVKEEPVGESSPKGEAESAEKTQEERLLAITPEQFAVMTPEQQQQMQLALSTPELQQKYMAKYAAYYQQNNAMQSYPPSNQFATYPMQAPATVAPQKPVQSELTASQIEAYAASGIPIGLQYPVSQVTVEVGKDIKSYGLKPKLQSSGAPCTYSVHPTLPLGVRIDSTNGELLGVPTEVTGTMAINVYASNTWGTAVTTIMFTVGESYLDDKDGDDEFIVKKGNRVYNTREEAMEEFEQLLRDENVTAGETWQQVQRRLKKDQRFYALHMMSARKRVWHKYVKEMTAAAPAQPTTSVSETKVRKEPRTAEEAFNNMLEEKLDTRDKLFHEDPTVYLRGDKRFKGVRKEQRGELISTYLIVKRKRFTMMKHVEIARKKEELKKLLKELCLDAHDPLFHAKTPFYDLLKAPKFTKDRRFVVFTDGSCELAKGDAHDVYNQFCNDLSDAMEEDRNKIQQYLRDLNQTISGRHKLSSLLRNHKKAVELKDVNRQYMKLIFKQMIHRAKNKEKELDRVMDDLRSKPKFERRHRPSQFESYPKRNPEEKYKLDDSKFNEWNKFEFDDPMDPPSPERRPTEKHLESNTQEQTMDMNDSDSESFEKSPPRANRIEFSFSKKQVESKSTPKVTSIKELAKSHKRRRKNAAAANSRFEVDSPPPTYSINALAAELIALQRNSGKESRGRKRRYEDRSPSPRTRRSYSPRRSWSRKESRGRKRKNESYSPRRSYSSGSPRGSRRRSRSFSISKSRSPQRSSGSPRRSRSFHRSISFSPRRFSTSRTPAKRNGTGSSKRSISPSPPNRRSRSPPAKRSRRSPVRSASTSRSSSPRKRHYSASPPKRKRRKYRRRKRSYSRSGSSSGSRGRWRPGDRSMSS